MESDSVSIARACYDAYVRKDRASIEALIAPEFHFASSLDNRIDRKTYFERCWPNSEKLVDFDFIHLFPHQDRVFVTYIGRNVDGHRFCNTEIIRVRGTQIAEVEVYFGWSIPHRAAEGGFVDEP